MSGVTAGSLHKLDDSGELVTCQPSVVLVTSAIYICDHARAFVL